MDFTLQSSTMRIKELEQRSGMSRDTVRFYEKQGLISPPKRLINGYRDYDAHTLTELHFIRTARSVGFTLEDIRPAIPKLRQPPEQCADLLAALRRRHQLISAQIEQQQQQLQRLEQLMLRFEVPHPAQ